MGTLHRALLGAAALLVTGEALALAFGLRLRHRGSPWICARNDLHLIADLLIGIALVVLISLDGPRAALLGVGLALTLIHAWRVAEPLIGIEHPFTANVGLIAVNLLVLALALSGTVALLKQT